MRSDRLALPIPATPENLAMARRAMARRFVLGKWRERAAERGLGAPGDLSGACKFASLFARAVFGGELRGNRDHQHVALGGAVIDLTGAAGVARGDPYEHDPRFWMNPDHAESLGSCLPRVGRWVREFAERHLVKSSDAAPSGTALRGGRMGMDTNGFHGYGTSDDYFIQAVWPLASRELRRLSKEGRGFILRGRGRVLRGREVARELSGRMVEAILDVPNRGGGGGTVPLVVRVTGSHMTPGDGEYSVYMETPSSAVTHGYHEPMTGDPQADAAKVAGDIADMVDDMAPALPGGAAPTAARRAALRLVRASRKMHIKVVLDMLVVADEGLDLAEAIQDEMDGVNFQWAPMDVQDVTVESVEVTDSR